MNYLKFDTSMINYQLLTETLDNMIGKKFILLEIAKPQETCISGFISEMVSLPDFIKFV